MATVRITWTDINADEEGTHIYRDTSPIDLEALPAPLASVGQGVTSYDDDTADADTTYYYALAAYKGSYVAPFDAGSIVAGSPDYANAEIGDEIGGGVFAGVFTNENTQDQWYLIGSKDEAGDALWQVSYTQTGVTDIYDGLANTQTLLSLGDTPAAAAADSHQSGGQSDWYLPSEKELEKIVNELSLNGIQHPDFSSDYTTTRFSSTERADYSKATGYQFNGTLTATTKESSQRIRPVRRVPV